MNSKEALVILIRAGLSTPEGWISRLNHIALERLGPSTLELRFVGGQVCAVDFLPKGEHCTIFDCGDGWTINYFIGSQQIYFGPARSGAGTLEDTFQEFVSIRRALDVICAGFGPLSTGRSA